MLLVNYKPELGHKVSFVNPADDCEYVGEIIKIWKKKARIRFEDGKINLPIEELELVPINSQLVENIEIDVDDQNGDRFLGEVELSPVENFEIDVDDHNDDRSDDLPENLNPYIDENGVVWDEIELGDPSRPGASYYKNSDESEIDVDDQNSSELELTTVVDESQDDQAWMDACYVGSSPVENTDLSEVGQLGDRSSVSPVENFQIDLLDSTIVEKNTDSIDVLEITFDTSVESSTIVEKNTDSVDVSEITTAINLDQCEFKITECLNRIGYSFYEIGKTLYYIKQTNLFYPDYPDFISYCLERWDFSQSYVYFLTNSYLVCKNLINAGFQVLPSNESQCRVLSSLSPDKQIKVWQEVVTAPKITAKLLKQVVEPYTANYDQCNLFESNFDTADQLHDYLGTIPENTLVDQDDQNIQEADQNNQGDDQEDDQEDDEPDEPDDLIAEQSLIIHEDDDFNDDDDNNQESQSDDLVIKLPRVIPSELSDYVDTLGSDYLAFKALQLIKIFQLYFTNIEIKSYSRKDLILENGKCQPTIFINTQYGEILLTLHLAKLQVDSSDFDKNCTYLNDYLSEWLIPIEYQDYVYDDPNYWDKLEDQEIGFGAIYFTIEDNGDGCFNIYEKGYLTTIHPSESIYSVNDDKWYLPDYPDLIFIDVNEAVKFIYEAKFEKDNDQVDEDDEDDDDQNNIKPKLRPMTKETRFEVTLHHPRFRASNNVRHCYFWFSFNEADLFYKCIDKLAMKFKHESVSVSELLKVIEDF